MRVWSLSFACCLSTLSVFVACGGSDDTALDTIVDGNDAGAMSPGGQASGTGGSAGSGDPPPGLLEHRQVHVADLEQDVDVL